MPRIKSELECDGIGWNCIESDNNPKPHISKNGLPPMSVSISPCNVAPRELSTNNEGNHGCLVPEFGCLRTATI